MYTSLDPAKSGYVLTVFCFTFFVMELNVQVCVLPPNLTESGQLLLMLTSCLQIFSLSALQRAHRELTMRQSVYVCVWWGGGDEISGVSRVSIGQLERPTGEMAPVVHRQNS